MGIRELRPRECGWGPSGAPGRHLWRSWRLLWCSWRLLWRRVVRGAYGVGTGALQGGAGGVLGVGLWEVPGQGEGGRGCGSLGAVVGHGPVPAGIAGKRPPGRNGPGGVAVGLAGIAGPGPGRMGVAFRWRSGGIQVALRWSTMVRGWRGGGIQAVLSGMGATARAIIRGCHTVLGPRLPQARSNGCLCPAGPLNASEALGVTNGATLLQETGENPMSYTLNKLPRVIILPTCYDARPGYLYLLSVSFVEFPTYGERRPGDVGRLRVRREVHALHTAIGKKAALDRR